MVAKAKFSSWWAATQHMIFSVTYYLELHNDVIVYCAYHFDLSWSNWLFGHYRTLTSLLGRKSTLIVKQYRNM